MFRREVEYGPFESQLRFHLLATPRKGFSGPVGSGKSLAFCHEALKLAYINGGCTGLIGAPTFPMLRDATQAAFLEILEENGVPYDWRKSENSIRLPEPDAKILFRSLDSFERLRGTNLAWFGIDELTYCHPEAWTRLEGRLRQPKAKVRCGFAAWTPKGFDWVYRMFLGPDKFDGYEAVIAKPFENRALPEGFYEQLRHSYDERFYQQEVLGQYLNQFSGAAYHAFDRKANVKPLEFDPRYPLCWALDFNIDPMCSVIAQVIDTTTREDTLSGRKNCVIRVLGEMALPDTRTEMACAEFRKRIQPWLARGLARLQIYGDASGSNRHSSSVATDWQVVREELKREPVHTAWNVPLKNPEVRARIIAVNAMLRNEAGQVRIEIDPSCKELIADLEQVGWKRDLAGNALDELSKKDPKRTHVSDALGYLVWHEAPVRAKGGFRSQLLIA